MALSGIGGSFLSQLSQRTPAVRGMMLLASCKGIIFLVKHPEGRDSDVRQKQHSRYLNILRGMKSSCSALSNDWHDVPPAPPPLCRGLDGGQRQGVSRNPCVTREAWDAHTHRERQTHQTKTHCYLLDTHTSAFFKPCHGILLEMLRSLAVFPGSTNTLNANNTFDPLLKCWKLLLSCAQSHWPQRDATPCCCWCQFIWAQMSSCIVCVSVLPRGWKQKRVYAKTCGAHSLHSGAWINFITLLCQPGREIFIKCID